jgi:hypothetical protein
MKYIGTIALFVGLLAWGTAANGSIIGQNAWDDGDGALVCNNAAWEAGTYTMHVTGDQFSGPGHIGRENLAISNAFFTTDTELDPTVTIRNTIDNDTGFSWTSYHVNVYMNKSFSLTDVTVYYPSTSETGWSGSVTGSVAETSLGSGVWLGQIDYVGGTPIPDTGLPVTGTLDFGYKMSFLGSVKYCQEFNPVPEPASIALVFAGLLGLVVIGRKFV